MECRVRHGKISCSICRTLATTLPTAILELLFVTNLTNSIYDIPQLILPGLSLRIQFANHNNSPITTPNKKTTHVFTIKQSPVNTGNPLDNAIANMGEYSEMDSDVVYLEREQAKVPEIKSVVVDFPLTMLFSVKEIPSVNNGTSKSPPAIRFNLKGTKPTQNLYFHSGKSTMIKFFDELHQHILLYRYCCYGVFYNLRYKIGLERKT